MAAPFTAPAISGYDDNPPADDGSQTEANRVKYSTTKSKLADPIKTLSEANVTATATAFAKIVGGGGVTASAISYQVVVGDQGKLVKITGASTTVTTPDATVVTSPFVFGLLNNSSGTITLDGSGSQTVNGLASLTIPLGGGCLCWTDGTNWFATGLQGVLAGKQLGYSEIINGTITEANGSNAATFSLKTLAGADPSTDDPVLICFRNPTSSTGNYVYRTVTAALSFTISSGSTLGTSSGVAFKLWLLLFDDAGTIRMGAINCLSGTNIYPLGRQPFVTTQAEGGAGGADSAHAYYTGTAVSSKAYVILGYAAYESGIATAGSWNASPGVIQLFGQGVPLPGSPIQRQRTATGAVATGTTVLPKDDTIPQNTEGVEWMTQAITPTSATNVLEINAQAHLANSAQTDMGLALFQDSTANALAASRLIVSAVDFAHVITLAHAMLAGATSATTFKIRGGAASAGTTTFNGAGAARVMGGVMNSYIDVHEIMA